MKLPVGAHFPQLRRWHAYVPVAVATLALLARCSADGPAPEQDLTGAGGTALTEADGGTAAGQPAEGVRTATVEWSSIPDALDDSAEAPFELSPLAVSPGSSTSFQGIAYTGSYPADSAGAVSADHVLTATNGSVTVRTRTGASVSSKTLKAFWTAFGMTDVQHPKVAYDPYSSRWIIAARGDYTVSTDAGSDTTYYIMVAASQTGDPTGAWYQYAVFSEDGDTSPYFTTLGFNKNWIVAGQNLSYKVPIFGIIIDEGSPLWVFNKSAVYTGAATTPTKLSRKDGIARQLYPATMLDSNTSDLYVLQTKDESAGALRLFNITGAVGAEALTQVAATITGPAWAPTAPSNTEFAPQQGTTTKIFLGDSRISSLVYRNGSLWTTHTVFYPTGTPTRSAVQWWQLSTTGSVLQRGVVDDANAVNFFAMPSLSVNVNNDMLLGYTRFSATQYASANYSFRFGTDTASTLRDDIVMKAGEGTYSRTPVFENNYWGWHGATVTDPVDDTGLWTLQQYAASGNGWGNYWGKVKPTVPVLTSPGNKTVAEGSNLTFTLSATDSGGEALTYSGSNLPSGATVSAAGVFSWTPNYSQAGTYSVTLTVTDTTFLSDSKTIQIVVTNVYDPPVLSSIGAKNGAEGSALSFTISATDPQGQTLNYTTSTLPSGASFNSSTRTFSWTPGYTQAGTYSVTFTVTDTVPLATSETVTITIANTNRSPTINAVSAKTGPEGAPITFTLSGSDPDGETLVYSCTNLPAGASVNGSTGAFAWTPDYTQAGTYNLNFVVTDPGGLTASTSATFTISNVNRAPTISVVPTLTSPEGTPITFTVGATDPDGEPLTYTAANLPSGATLSASTGAFSWTPSFTQANTYQVTFTVTDPGGLSASQSMMITITNTNRAPSIASVSSLTSPEGTAITFTLSATDPDGETLIYFGLNMPSGALVNPSTGVFSWVPDYTQAGTYTITFQAVDPGSLTASASATFTITNVNRPPAFSAVPPVTSPEGTAISFVLSAIDPDGDLVTYTCTNPPGGASVNSSSGAFSWTPNYNQANTYVLTFIATDPSGLTGSTSTTITVTNTNRSPVFTGMDTRTGAEGSQLSFTVAVDDPDGDAIALSASGIPPGASFNSTTRRFTWTPGFDQDGTYQVTFTATDSGGVSTVQVTTIFIANTNRAPAINPITAQTGAEGTPISFTVTATDADGDDLTYAATGLPNGATFGSATGKLTWTPSYTQAGTYQITFSVTDSGGLQDGLTVLFTIANTNRAPQFSPLLPPEVLERQTMTFTLSATDPDGESVTYSAVGLPQGATLNPTTGVFNWPTLFGQGGTYQVSFGASDGSVKTTLFATLKVIVVNDPPVLAAQPNITAVAGRMVTFTLSATDPDGDPVTYSITPLPFGAQIDASSGTFSWATQPTQKGNYPVAVKALDARGLFTTAPLTITLVQNKPPVLAAIGPKSGAEASSLSFQVSATDDDGDALTYSATNLPAGATFNPATLTFVWMPGYSQAGTTLVTFTVSDGLDTSSEIVPFTISNTNRPPVLTTIGPKSGAEGSLLAFALAASDPDGDSLQSEAINLPSGATFDTVQSRFSWTPDYIQAGSYEVTFRVRDAEFVVEEKVTLTIADTNRAPVIDPVAEQFGSEGTALSFTVAANDPDGDTYTFSASNLPTGATFDDSTLLFSWTPGYEQSGSHTVTITATDSRGGSSQQVVKLTIANTNRLPIWSAIADQTGAEGTLLTFTAVAVDPDGETLTYSLTNAPAGAVISPSTGVFTWVPGFAQAGTAAITFHVTDTHNAEATVVVNFTITNTNQAPQLTPIGTQHGAEGTPLTFTVAATDVDGDAVTYAADSLPTGATLDAATGAFLWTPDYKQAGAYSVTFRAQDPSGAKASEVVSIVIANTNRPPSLEPVEAQTVRRGVQLQLTVVGADPDGDEITWSAKDLPPDAAFNAATQLFEWTPRADAPNLVTVKFSATDGSLSSTISVDITVTLGQPPTIEPIPEVTVVAGHDVEFLVKTADPDGDFVFLTADAVPSTATFERRTGVFTWIPSTSDIGRHEVTFTGRDVSGNSASTVAVITVTSGGKAKQGCGCSTGVDMPGLLLLGAAALLKRRRARTHQSR